MRIVQMERAGGERRTGVTEAPEAELIARALGGDERACALLVRGHLRKAMAVAVELAPTREDAEDLVQEAFRAAFASLHRFESGRPFGPWLFTILRNAARNAAASRRVRSHEALTADHASRRATPLEDAQRRELRRAIEEAIERLPEGQRTCFRLCVVEELTGAEAASATGLAESTVRVQVFKARRALRSLLARWREEVGGG